VFAISLSLSFSRDGARASEAVLRSEERRRKEELLLTDFCETLNASFFSHI